MVQCPGAHKVSLVHNNLRKMLANGAFGNVWTQPFIDHVDVEQFHSESFIDQVDSMRIIKC